MSTPEPPLPSEPPEQPPRPGPSDPTWAPPGTWRSSTPAPDGGAPSAAPPSTPSGDPAAPAPSGGRTAPAAPAAPPPISTVKPYHPGVPPTATPTAPPYGAPGGQPYGAAGAPPYGGPGGYPAPGPVGPAAGGTPWNDGFAVASFAAAIASLFCLGVLGPLALALGLVARRRARRAGRPPGGLVRTGVILGAIETVLLVVAIVVWVVVQPLDRIQDAADRADGTVRDAGPEYELPLDLTAGTCFLGFAAADDLSDVTEVDCAEPHDSELTAVLPIDAPLHTLPIDQIAQTEAACMRTNALFGTAPQEKATSPDSYGHYMVWPHGSQWDDGGRAAYCLFGSKTGQTTGSLVDGTSDLLP